MPQLDVYIICNMLYGVITLFIFTYMLNIVNVLITINLLLRIRKLKICLDKIDIAKLLKEALFIIKLRYYIYTFDFLKLFYKRYKDTYYMKYCIDKLNLKNFLYVLQDK